MRNTTPQEHNMKSNTTMYELLVRKYKYDTRYTSRDKSLRFVPNTELERIYGENGFNVIPSKYQPTAMEKHVQTWMWLGKAKPCNYHGVDGIIISV